MYIWGLKKQVEFPPSIKHFQNQKHMVPLIDLFKKTEFYECLIKKKDPLSRKALYQSVWQIKTHNVKSILAYMALCFSSLLW